MDLASLYSILSLHLSDLSSPLYRGLVSSCISPLVPVRVQDPSGVDRPSPTDPAPARDPFALHVSRATVYEHPRPMNNTLAIILGVVGGVALLTIIAAVSTHTPHTHTHSCAALVALAGTGLEVRKTGTARGS